MNLRFAADRTLGKLAKWLRILGFDTIYESESGEKAFYAELASERILLTRDSKILKQYAGRRPVFIESNYPFEQLQQVMQLLNLTLEDAKPFSICIRCNLPLIDIDKNALKGRVPDYIRANHDSFKTCSSCRKIYWPGSHTRRSLEKIRQFWSK